MKQYIIEEKKGKMVIWPLFFVRVMHIHPVSKGQAWSYLRWTKLWTVSDRKRRYQDVIFIECCSPFGIKGVPI